MGLARNTAQGGPSGAGASGGARRGERPPKRQKNTGGGPSRRPKEVVPPQGGSGRARPAAVPPRQWVPVPRPDLAWALCPLWNKPMFVVAPGGGPWPATGWVNTAMADGTRHAAEALHHMQLPREGLRGAPEPPPWEGEGPAAPSPSAIESVDSSSSGPDDAGAMESAGDSAPHLNLDLNL